MDSLCIENGQREHIGLQCISNLFSNTYHDSQYATKASTTYLDYLRPLYKKISISGLPDDLGAVIAAVRYFNFI